MFHLTCSSEDHWTVFQVSQSLVVRSHAASSVDCGDPTNTSSEVIVQYTSTRVGSVIFYQCRQSEFDPSSLSSVCMEDGRWSADPSQVVCRMVTTTMPMPTGTENTRALLTGTYCT